MSKKLLVCTEEVVGLNEFALEGENRKQEEDMLMMNKRFVFEDLALHSYSG